MMKFEEEEYDQIQLEELTILQILGFVSTHRFSTVSELSEETFSNIFTERLPTFILMTVKGGRVLKTFKEIANSKEGVRGLTLHMRSETPNNVEEQLFQITGIDVSELPVLVMLPMNKEFDRVFPKYRTSKLSKRAMQEFFEQSLAGELEYYKRSETLRTDPRSTGYTQITLNNFDEFVIKSNKWFLFGLDTVEKEKEIVQSFSKMAKVIKEFQAEDKLEVGLSDILKNEFNELFMVTAIPFIVLVQNGDISNAQSYTGELKLSKLRRWLQRKTGIKLNRMDISKEADAPKEEAEAKTLAEEPTNEDL